MVDSLVQQSERTGKSIFALLSGAASSNVQRAAELDQRGAGQRRHPARPRHRPERPGRDEAGAAGRGVGAADAPGRIANIAGQIQPALARPRARMPSTRLPPRWRASTPPMSSIRTTRTHQIAAALHAASISVGGSTGVPIGRAVPDRHSVAESELCGRPKLHVRPELERQAGARPARSFARLRISRRHHAANRVQQHHHGQPGAHVHAAISPTGQNTETNVVCKVTVNGTSISGQSTVPQTAPGQSATCQVPLGSPPPAGSATVDATVEPVPGEKNTANNT